MVDIPDADNIVYNSQLFVIKPNYAIYAIYATYAKDYLLIKYALNPS
jgi:hypothetical protein